MAPPEVAISLATKPSGVSEKVKVIVALWPAPSAAVLLVMDRVGGRVSRGMVAPMAWFTINCSSPVLLFQTLKVPEKEPLPVMVPALAQVPSRAVKVSPALPVMSS